MALDGVCFAGEAADAAADWEASCWDESGCANCTSLSKAARPQTSVSLKSAS